MDQAGVVQRVKLGPPQPWVATLVRTIFDQADATEVTVQFDRVVEALAQKLPRSAKHLEETKADLLAFTTYPRQIWRQIWSSNPQERLNKEIRGGPTSSVSSRTAKPSYGSSAPFSRNNR
jgi:transposase-like protein